MDIQVQIEYKGKCHASEIRDYNDEDLKILETLVEKTMEGKEGVFFCMDTGAEKKYFPYKVLQESIISIYRGK